MEFGDAAHLADDGTTLGVGSSYQVPNSIVSPRIMKISLNVAF